MSAISPTAQCFFENINSLIEVWSICAIQHRFKNHFKSAFLNYNYANPMLFLKKILHTENIFSTEIQDSKYRSIVSCILVHTLLLQSLSEWFTTYRIISCLLLWLLVCRSSKRPLRLWFCWQYWLQLPMTL